MLCIHIKSRDPYFCLAAEEYLLKNFNEDVFMLWQSENTVVVGKHQNLLAEINYPFVRENNINLARRISGGGTVFHDAGNVNFVFLKSFEKADEISFRRFLAPVAEALAKLGISTNYSDKDDLLINGLKVSGNAEHVFKKRVLHHGTLLFNSDLKNLGQAIKVVPGKYESKAVQSNRSQVTNIASYLDKKISVGEFIQFLYDFQLEKHENKAYTLTENDIQSIEKLADEKFKTWDWIFGYSPKYSFKNDVVIEGKTLSVELNVVKGIIQKGTISGDYFTQKENKELSAELESQRHYFKTIFELLKSISPGFPSNLTDIFF